MAYAYTTRWESEGVVHDTHSSNLAPVVDEDLDVDYKFYDPSPAGPPHDPPVENTVATESVVGNQPPMVWEVIENHFQIGLHDLFD